MTKRVAVSGKLQRADGGGRSVRVEKCAKITSELSGQKHCRVVRAGVPPLKEAISLSQMLRKSYVVTGGKRESSFSSYYRAD